MCATAQQLYTATTTTTTTATTTTTTTITTTTNTNTNNHKHNHTHNHNHTANNTIKHGGMYCYVNDNRHVHKRQPDMTYCIINQLFNRLTTNQ